jgi:type IV pilus assembly protein PilY1
MNKKNQGKNDSSILVALNVILATTICSSNLYADDIEVYTSVTNGSSTASANHNILFVMDTSGSMGSAVAGLTTSGGYDADTDYGESDDKIYVYDANFSFTDKTIEYEQNACKSMTNVFGTATNYPVYFDQGAQWQQTTDVIPGDVDCSTTTTGPRETIAETSAYERDRNEWVTLVNNKTIIGGEEFSFTVHADRRTEFYLRTRKNNSDYDYPCYDVRVDGNSYTCSGIVPDGHTQLSAWVYTKRSRVTITYSGTLGGGSTEICTSEPDTDILTNDWKTALLTSTDPSSVFECANDSGNHGLDDASGDKYIAGCAAGVVCNSPVYSSDSADEFNWSTSSSQYFVPGNYHDYLLNGGTVDIANLLADEQNADTYCNQTSRIGDIFVDSETGLIFECFKRLTVMKNAVANLVSSLSQSPVNVGLMRFNRQDDDGIGTQGGTVVDAISAIATNSDFSTTLDNLPASGGTPLSESLYEAYLYFSGKSLDYGRTTGCGTAECTDTTSQTDGIYLSPITDSCQSNNIIFLSDGSPSSSDGGRDGEIQTVAGVGDCGTTGGAGKCLDEIAGVMATQDMNLGVSGVNTVKTYTIGLEIDLPLLEDTAVSGKGEYFTASSASDLEEAFQSIIVDILTDASSFVAPAVSVNAFNELQHRNEIYYAVFQPAGTPRWYGNVKKYRLSADGDVQDSNGDPAVDAASGFFDDDAVSFWTELTAEQIAEGRTGDGPEVTLGGAANELSTARIIYTEVDGGTPFQLTADKFDLILPGVLNAGSDDDRDNTLNWLLGIDTFDFDNDNGFTEPARFLADPLHSQPVVITYGGSIDTPDDVLFFATNLGTLHAVDPADGTELWAYLPSEHQPNLQSYIQAPNSLQHTYGLDGAVTIVSDGNLVRQTSTDDDGNDTTGDVFVIEKVRLYIGERRGGSSYYGLDISNARLNATPSLKLDNSYNTPFKKLWSKTGAMHGTNAEIAATESADIGFRDLAQTWSKMVPATIKIDDGDASTNDDTDVLIFSGGYDPRHDDTSYSSTDSTDTSDVISDYGNAIYIVNADTGSLIYSIGNNDDDDDADRDNTNNRNLDRHKLPLPMESSIPAEPTVIDIDNDGYVDMIFVADITGHIWRIDINTEAKPEAGTGFATGGMIADLSSDTELRRFYNSVSVSRSDRRTGSDHLNIIVGSGYRASPSTIEDWDNKLYFVLDEYPSARIYGDGDDDSDQYNYVTTDGGSSRVIVASDLLPTSTASPVTKATAPYGFYRTFTGGEKILQSATTFNNRVLFSTFNVNSGDSSSACGGGLGEGRTYVLNLYTGASVLTQRDANNNIDTTASTGESTNEQGQVIAEYHTLSHQGIPADSTLLLLPQLAVCIGTECNIDSIQDALLGDTREDDDDGDDPSVTGTALRTFWLEE